MLLVTNADLRESANVECWPVQNRYEESSARRCPPAWAIRPSARTLYKGDKGHGFISSQREGSDLFATIDPDALVIAAHRLGNTRASSGTESRQRTWAGAAARQLRRHSRVDSSACCAWPER